MFLQKSRHLPNPHHCSLPDIDDTHTAFDPPIADSHVFLRDCHLALGLFELDNWVERLDVAARKRSKVHRERTAGTQRDVNAHSLRRRRVERGEKRVGGVNELWVSGRRSLEGKKKLWQEGEDARGSQGVQ